MNSKSVKIFTVFIWLIFTYQGIATVGDPLTKISFHISDIDGKPIANLPYQAASLIYYSIHSGSHDNTINVNSHTDQNGNVTFSIPSGDGEIASGTPYDIKGYYPVSVKYLFKSNSGGKWQPWNPTIEVVVKPIFNPIAMYAKNINIDIPTKNTPLGFDLEAADWVAPYGKGTVSDFIFTMTEKIPFTKYNQPYDLTWTLAFSNKADGIQSAVAKTYENLCTRMICDAPESGYKSNLVQELSLNGSKRITGSDGENQNYFFRVRTLLDEHGKVKSALYGKIAGPIQYWGNSDVHMIYYLNPTPNDRNMEFDPKKNLFQNLPPLQQVKSP